MARILIVEDNPVNLELTGYLLRAWGHETLTAMDGLSGIETARREQPELIVCDIQMPGIDGYELARRLKADPALRATPLLAVSALAMVGDRERALQAGFDGHVAKPIDPAAFVATVASFLPGGTAGARPAPAAPELAPDESLAQRPLPEDLCAPRPGLVILMVDDTAANLAFKLSLLEPAGYRVLTADGGERALEIARSCHVDLILSDVVMTRGGGFELVSAVRADAALRATAFVFLTATARDEHSRERGLALGADAYLIRPVDPKLLLAELRRWLA